MAKSKKYKKNRQTKRRNNKRITRRGGGFLSFFSKGAPVAQEASKLIGPIGSINIGSKTLHKTFINKKYYEDNYPALKAQVDENGFIYKYNNESNIYVIPNYQYHISTNPCIHLIFNKLTGKTYNFNKIYENHKDKNPFIGIVINLKENKCAYFVFLQNNDNDITIEEYGEQFDIQKPEDGESVYIHINNLIKNC